MPYTLKAQQIAVKDPDTGAYVGVDVLTEQTTEGILNEIAVLGNTKKAEVTNEGSTQITNVQNAGASTVALVNNTVTQSQTAVNNLVSQKDDLVESVTDMLSTGTDNSLTTPSVPADAKAVGDLYETIVIDSTTQPNKRWNRVWVKPSEEEVEIPTMDEFNRLSVVYANEIAKSQTNYDASRINNSQTVDSTTGDAYPAVGRCMTNSLNGSLYPMDAVYIDSDAYTFRMFGYSAMPITSNTYLGCTDYVVCGKNSIIYRDPSWNVCRLVIARNPKTDYTAFTAEEITDIAAKIYLLQFADLQDDIERNSNRINAVEINTENVVASVEGLRDDVEQYDNRISDVESKTDYTAASIADIGNYIFDNLGNYDASRINNSQTVDSTTGDAYPAVGRCMTNSLNGSLYPMDAVYIDSDAYTFRMFGYSAMPMTSATYLGCTDYVVCGKNSIIYRDPSWNVCRLVIARNPKTDYTAFTAEEISDIASKIYLLKNKDLQKTIEQNSNRIGVVETETDYAVASIANIGNYIFDNLGNYDASRINNGKTVDPSTGNAYDAVGRCMTNALNGSSYPMDAAYIDSDAYTFRMFGYSAMPMTSATYLGCTDYIVCGENGVLYRDPSWVYARLVVTRNPTTDYTAFTAAEIENIATKLNLLKKQSTSVDIDYFECRLLGLHTIPQSTGVLNVIKRARQLTDIKWKSEINIPRVSMIDSDNYDSIANYVDDVFLANTDYTGVPYSSQNFVGDSVSINTFVTAIHNSRRSKMKDSVKVDRNTAAMYGTVCVTFTSYALRIPIVSSSYYHLIPDFILIGTVPNTLDTLQLGDVIIEASHSALITDIIRENNTVKYVEISESTKHGLENIDKQGMQWGGICRRKLWSADEYVRWFGNFSLYRYSKIDGVPFEVNNYVDIGDGLGIRKNPYLACMPYEGDYYHYSRSLASVNIIICDTHYTSLVVYKDGIQLATYPVTAQTEFVTISLDGAGYYTANLLDDSGHASGLCHWFVNTTTDITYTVTSGVANFIVKRAIDTPPISVRFNTINNNPVNSYHVHIVENLQKSFDNNQYVYTFTVPVDVETITNYYIYLDAGEYGIVVLDR